MQRLEEACAHFQPEIALFYALPKGEGFFGEDGRYFFERMDIPYVSLFYDNPFLYFQQLGQSGVRQLRDSSRYCIFCSDKIYVEELKKKGFPRTEYLPLAADAQMFSPATGQEPGQEHACALSFIGSIDDDPCTLKARRRARWKKYPVLNWLIDSLTDPKKYFTSLSVARRLRALQPEMAWEVYAVFCRTVYEEALTTLRMQTIKELSPEPVEVYGNAGWQAAGFDHVQYRGPVAYGPQSAAVYRSSRINLNITSPQLITAVNQRVFDVSACCGFVITDERADNRELFGDTLVEYRSAKDLKEKVRYYLTHDADRKSLAEAARQVVLKHHTWEHRAQSILDCLACARVAG
jgi:spore maturation protein CgeB